MRVKLLRVKAGITQMQLAKLLGISENQLSKIESGRVFLTQSLHRQIRDVVQGFNERRVNDPDQPLVHLRTRLRKASIQRRSVEHNSGVHTNGK